MPQPLHFKKIGIIRVLLKILTIGAGNPAKIDHPINLRRVDYQVSFLDLVKESEQHARLNKETAGLMGTA